MAAFKLSIRSNTDGSFAPAWFDNDTRLWDDPRLRSPLSLIEQWTMPNLKLHIADQPATPILFNPNALAFSASLKNKMTEFPEIEWLPINIQGHGTYFIFHVTTAIELPDGSNAVVGLPPGGNLAVLHSFPSNFCSPLGFFRVWHPVGSAGRKVGRCTSGVFLGTAAKASLEVFANEFLEARSA
ncbi:hypothetical protein H8K35_10490 [Undibacterium sp. LX40W]|uniref:Uncharacterized protein n=1 Tax=Undibacterium nitidum TaxID=2762298 RepID=A0A923HQ08_9BURK|nr:MULTISPECIES: hypothetical protein [Undibacterium]MBC3881916.1 hypothetical protein [Undibacterium nitidum]MBC3892087.1 hypothetical protein [Undibacterium sp. LX40W]